MQSQKQEFLESLHDKSLRIGILGLGYVGLPLVLRFSEAGFGVTGLDIDEEKVRQLNAGKSYIEHISAESVQALHGKGFKATADFSLSAECDVLILCVPTPLNKYREPDLSYVTSTIESILPHMRAGQMISLESTTYPGTTDEELVPRIQSRGFEVGKDIFVVFSPEREDPGNANFSTRTIPKVCGGYSADCLEVGCAVYSAVIDRVVPVSSLRAAELTKLLENIYRAVNIGLVNEMKIVADRMGIDIHEVISAAATKPFGFVPYYPGPGIGGHCIPIDPFYLTWKAREYGLHTRFIELAGEINSSMPDYVVNKLLLALNEKQKPIKAAKILVLGIAYKRDVDDMRESPSIILIEKLQELGAMVDYSDSHVPVIPKLRGHTHLNLQSVPLNAATLASYDCVLLATDHSDFDYDAVLKSANLIVDTRGRFPANHAKVVRA
jgi:UDP-N-acetyl-D-glucosamine dehydrogenase